LASQRDDRNRSPEPGKRHHKCDHCGRLGKKSDMCHALHGCPPRFVVVVQTNSPSKSPTWDTSSININDEYVIFSKFLKWYKDQQPSSSTTSVGFTNSSYVGLISSSSLGR